MTLTIELDPQTEARLAAEAERAGIAEPELALKLLQQHLPGSTIDDKTREENQVLLDLFERWRVEDAGMSPEELDQENRLQQEFEAGINEARREQGMRTL